MYKTMSEFVNSPEYLMISSRERRLKEKELRKKHEKLKNAKTSKSIDK